MGHLFSRALKRITQGAQPTRSQQLHNQSPSEQQDTTNDTSYASDKVQSIPVGQSIDSAEYAGLQQRVSTASRSTASKVAEQEQEAEAVTEPQRNVEEAAIKIQALVRGHLTRKALKDAHSHSIPPHRHALGQRQFDEECLLGSNNNPATTSPIFLNLSPPAVAAAVEAASPKDTSSQDNRLPTGREGTCQRAVEPNTSSATLSSIAEHTKLGTPPQLAEPEQGEQAEQSSLNAPADRKKLPLKLCTRASTYPSQLLDTESPDTRDHSLSPVPSEANASIDLNYDTPASASIDIGDHRIQPVDRLASVLHHKSSVSVPGEVAKEREAETAKEDSSDAANKLTEIQERQEQCIRVDSSTEPSRTTTTTTITGPTEQTEMLGNGDLEHSASNYNTNGNNHEEAAAIRIQSAFRGYRTRKNSPYRIRSPPSNSPSKLQGEQLLNGTSPPVEYQNERLSLAEERLSFDTSADISPELVPNLGGRRSSRPRARNSSDRQTTITDQQYGTGANHEERQVAVATNDDDYVLSTVPSQEDCLQSQQDHWRQANADRTKPLDQTSQKEPMMRVETFDTATSNNEEPTNDLTEANESELGSETVAALLGMTTIESLAPDEKRTSVKSGASIETIGSSIAGALLSMDDEVIAAMIANNPTEIVKTHASSLDEDKSLGGGGVVSLTVDEFDLEGSRLEMSTGAEELIDQGGALVEDSAATTDDQPVDHRQKKEFVQASEERKAVDDIKTLDNEVEGVSRVDESDQLTIELESDDIERRDPRGQATTERTKSPTVFEAALVADEEEEEEVEEVEEEDAKEDATCKFAAPVITSASQSETAMNQQQQQTSAVDESATSLESSPRTGLEQLGKQLADSSSSSGDDEADEDGDEHLNENRTLNFNKQQSRNQQQQQSPTRAGTISPSGKNKKRHRNKRKNAKK